MSNPGYKGVWEAKKINTPENVDDDEIYTFDELCDLSMGVLEMRGWDDVEKAIDAGVVLSCLCDVFWLDSTVVLVLSACGWPGTFQNRSLMSVCEKVWHPLSISDMFEF